MDDQEDFMRCFRKKAWEKYRLSNVFLIIGGSCDLWGHTAQASPKTTTFENQYVSLCFLGEL